MSEYPHDEEELQELLSGKSPISRRYQEAGGEEPPAHVDSAILAASRWAVGADRNTGPKKIGSKKAGSKETESEKTGPDRTLRSGSHAASRHAAARWRNNLVARWSIPLATAAVVVIAATLTLIIERDPEIDRIRQRYDTAPTIERAPSEPATDNAAQDISRDEQPTVAKPAPRTLPEKPAAPAPAPRPRKDELAKKESERAETLKKQVAAQKAVKSAAPEKQTAKSDQPRPATADKASETREQERAASSVVVSEAPEPTPQAQLAARPAEAEQPAQALADNAAAVSASESDAQDTEASFAGANDASVLAGANIPAETKEAVQPEGATAGRVQPFPQLPEAAPQTENELAEPAPPAEMAAAQSVREPEQWIKDIEELLAQGKRAEAIDSLEKFRHEYPDYELAPRLQALLPAADNE